MKMIVGLGNPGAKYEKTKHNVGFWVIDAIAEALGIVVNKKEQQALTGQGIYRGEKILLVKPQTFMNLSGQAVIQLLHYYGDRIDDLLVIQDDLALAPGQLRFRQKGSAGGHNGIKSIISHLGSQEFDRLKVGIGQSEGEVVHHVLSPFGKETAQILEAATAEACTAVLSWSSEGMFKTMNQYNKKPSSTDKVGE